MDVYFSGPVTLGPAGSAAGGTSAAGTMRTINQGNTAGNIYFTGAIADGVGGAGGIIKTGSGALMLTGSNTYSGPTIVNQGTIVINSDTAIPLASQIELANNGNQTALGVWNPSTGWNVNGNTNPTLATTNRNSSA